MFAVAATALLSGCVSDNGSKTIVGELQFHDSTAVHDRTYFYQAQTASVTASCMPQSLLRILGHIRERTGVRPILTSGHRSRGRKGSMHRHCRAADIRVPGVSDTRVVEIARTAPGIGGVGRYCNGIVHVDVGPRREWAECAGRRRGGARR
ncbi:DUF882 domain-containing protein [Rhizobium laguerreae]|uniref:YcbK family protein n=1 Tax=Rhizobium laguerreae TaxID=1076926 RepID=UPI001C902382|nr:D-Ala-D-Ala carboxypeptidase family metallohydrolase [Rhizobium laguerreae]MBY3155404.1 DUF882 domain-containing protein [Rhizobium laguerreae]